MKSLVFAAVISFSFVASALDYSGVYSGQFNNKAGFLKIGNAGSGVLTAQFETIKGDTDILLDCGAHIGAMTKAKITTKDGNVIIKSAEFALDPGTCTYIAGRTLVIDFKHKGGNVVGASASLLFSVTDIPGQCLPTDHGQWCTPDHQEFQFMEGSFQKL